MKGFFLSDSLICVCGCSQQRRMERGRRAGQARGGRAACATGSCMSLWVLGTGMEGQWDSRTAGQLPSLAPLPQACAGCCTTASQPRLRDAQSHRTSPCIQQSASVSNAGKTITNTQCRKLICRQTSVLITGKVKKKNPLSLRAGSCQLAFLRVWETQSTMTVLIQLFSTM